MKHSLAVITAAISCLALSCSSRPPVREVVASATGGYCAHVQGYLSPTEVQAQLLFASAEAALASGERYFRVVALTASGSPNVPAPGPQDQSGGLREGHMCFEYIVPSPDAPNVYDSIKVVQEAPDALRRHLSAAARKNLQRLSPSNPSGA